MTMKNYKITSMLIILAFMSSIPYMFNAYATDCSVSHCYAQLTHTNSNNGNQYTSIIANLGSTSCGTFGAVTQWVGFANGDWLESGYATGTVGGSCYSSGQERSYYVIYIAATNSYTEYNVGSLTAGTTKTFEISDTDQNRYWQIVIGGSTVANNLLMSSATSTNVQVGEEGDVNNPSSTFIPSTHLYSIQKYSSGSWSSPTSVSFFEGNEADKYWAAKCGSPPSATHLHVNTGSSEVTCTGSH